MLWLTTTSVLIYRRKSYNQCLLRPNVEKSKRPKVETVEYYVPLKGCETQEEEKIEDTSVVWQERVARR